MSRVDLNRLARLAQRLPGRGRPVFLTCVYGLAAGLAAVAFQVAMNALYKLTFAVGFLLTQYAPEASGSGIPQLKLAFWKDFGFVPWRLVWVKFVAGVLSIGGGCSLGREGPSVQLAGGLTSNLAGLLGEPKQKRRMAAAADSGGQGHSAPNP